MARRVGREAAREALRIICIVIGWQSTVGEEEVFYLLFPLAKP
jgi:hypothetical protein